MNLKSLYRCHICSLGWEKWTHWSTYDEKRKVITILSGVSLGPDANPLKQRSGPQVNDKSMTLSVRIVSGFGLKPLECLTLLWVVIQSRLWLNYQASFNRGHHWTESIFYEPTYRMSEPIQIGCHNKEVTFLSYWTTCLSCSSTIEKQQESSA